MLKMKSVIDNLISYSHTSVHYKLLMKNPMLQLRLLKILFTTICLFPITACLSQTIQFKSITVPSTTQEKQAVRATSNLQLGKAMDGKTTFPLSYQVIARSGESFPSGVFGQLVDHQGNPIHGADGEPHIHNSNDFSSLLQKDGQLFNISHFESIPGAIYITTLNQDPSTGVLTATDTRPIDLSATDGGWVHCAGSISPWNTHLASEEYPSNAAKLNLKDGTLDDYYNRLAPYFGGDLKQATPYAYGFVTEIEVLNKQGEVRVNKHYAMGRLSIELAYVMPDKKTAYISDDGTNVGFFMFIADQEENLTAGTLFAAKWQQTSADAGGTADISWISLGHARNADVRKLIEQRIQFSDIFTSHPAGANFNCPKKSRSINTSDGHECLELKPGMALAASRLETRRYAAYLGATTEFRKTEGITHNTIDNKLYLTASELTKGMEDNKSKGKRDNSFDRGGPNHIRLSDYNSCGAVYAFDLEKKTLSTQTANISSDYVASRTKPILLGRPTLAHGGTEPNYDTAGPHANNKCHLEGIANPDNLSFMNGYDTLIISEDTGSGHENNVLWAYNIKEEKLTRLLTSPIKAEVTSAYWFPNINGFGYLMAVVQHPFGNAAHLPIVPNNASPSDSRQGTANRISKKSGYTGYIGPFPTLDK